MAMKFEIPENSVQKIKQLRPSPEHGIRITVRGGGCSGLYPEMVWTDHPEDTDVIIPVNGIIVFIEKKSSFFLNEATLEFHEGLTDSGFKLVSSKMKDKCGCGASFSV